MPRTGKLFSRKPRGFTVFECIVAMFILLIGLLGVVSVFSVGMNSRLKAQELLISSDLATMWSDWVRSRLNESKGSGGAQGILHLADLDKDLSGDFYADAGDLHFAPPGDPRNLPTFQVNVYAGYKWKVEAAGGTSNYRPQWMAEDGSGARDWSKRSDGGAALPGAMGAMPKDMLEVKLTIYRGTRIYDFFYLFSGVGLKYEKL